MSIVDILQQVIIYPLSALLEASFMLCYRVFGEVPYAILGISVTVSLLTLPLYIVAERWSWKERQTQKSLEPSLKRIKSVFTGDEQYMMITALYRERHYHPLMALRSSIGLLIQIPFFIAAYSFLSHLSMLDGEEIRLLGIKNLAAPDGMITIMGYSINLLPALMTAVNIIAGAIYTKGLMLKDKVPIYAMALLFLVLLYTSPSGLVLYWTMNNVFSLVKNIFYKIKNPLRTAYIILCAFVAAVVIYLIFLHHGFLYRRIMCAIAFSLMPLAPLIVKGALALLGGALKPLVKCKTDRTLSFVMSALCLALLLGAAGPLFVIGSSAVEFCGIDDVSSPLCFVSFSFLQSAGLFVFWPLCIYLLFGERIQTLIAAFFVLLLLVSLTDTFIFPSGAGSISRLMTFDNPVNFPPLSTALLNILLILLALSIAMALIGLNKTKILNSALLITAVALTLTAAVQCTKIQKEVNALNDAVALSVGTQDSEGPLDNESVSPMASSKDIKSVYHLSKTGRNVIVIMMDRAESAYLRPIFKAFSEFTRSFDGFVYYPNTASYNQGTLLGAPPLYGGYLYTPLEMNKRSGEKLVDKHTEALLMMPRIFTEQAMFSATVSDLSWAGYKWIPDMSITDPYPLIKGFNTERKYSDLWVKEHPNNVQRGLTKKTIQRNMLYFSVFKAAPTFLREAIYDEGNWWSADEVTADIMGFIDYYSVLDYLPRLTDTNGEGDVFIMFSNNTTHSGENLYPPDYEPTTKKISDDLKKSRPVRYASASGNIAMYKLLGRWLDVLKEEGCYDNTRIIIAADHGIGRDDALFLAPYKGWDYKAIMDGKCYNPDHNNPLFLVKDFGSRGALTTDYRFMTNADVMQEALKGIVSNPINPWTNEALVFPAQSEKKALGVVLTHMWNPGSNVYTFKVPDKDFVTIKDNIFIANNWQEGIKQ